jgi:hypothetical protein
VAGQPLVLHGVPDRPCSVNASGERFPLAAKPLTGPALRENKFWRAYIAVLREASMTRIAPDAALLATALALLAAIIALPLWH